MSRAPKWRSGKGSRLVSPLVAQASAAETFPCWKEGRTATRKKPLSGISLAYNFLRAVGASGALAT